MDVAKLGLRKANVRARKTIHASYIRLYHRIIHVYVLGICLQGLHGFSNKVGVQEKNLWANPWNRRRYRIYTKVVIILFHAFQWFAKKVEN